MNCEMVAKLKRERERERGRERERERERSEGEGGRYARRQTLIYIGEKTVFFYSGSYQLGEEKEMERKWKEWGGNGKVALNLESGIGIHYQEKKVIEAKCPQNSIKKNLPDAVFHFTTLPKPKKGENEMKKGEQYFDFYTRPCNGEAMLRSLM